MRTIQFRGKHVNDESVFANEWVCGDLLHTADGVPHIHQVETDSYFEIYPATVGQFTGLLDKNGKEIYEGDICVAKTASAKFSVEFSSIGYNFMACFLSDRAPLSWFADNKHGIEVIGNIHDNPE